MVLQARTQCSTPSPRPQPARTSPHTESTKACRTGGGIAGMVLQAHTPPRPGSVACKTWGDAAGMVFQAHTPHRAGSAAWGDAAGTADTCSAAARVGQSLMAAWRTRSPVTVAERATLVMILHALALVCYPNPIMRVHAAQPLLDPPLPLVTAPPARAHTHSMDGPPQPCTPSTAAVC